MWDGCVGVYGAFCTIPTVESYGVGVFCSRPNPYSCIPVITTIIPALKAEVKNSGDSMNGDHPDYNLLCHYSNNPPSYRTVLRWVHYLGFRQDKFKKSFYVDGHEHLSQILHPSKSLWNT